MCYTDECIQLSNEKKNKKETKTQMSSE